jgi:hypothetical protein
MPSMVTRSKFLAHHSQRYKHLDFAERNFCGSQVAGTVHAVVDPSSRRSHARAKLQSRITVFSEMPSAAAVSSTVFVANSQIVLRTPLKELAVPVTGPSPKPLQGSLRRSATATRLQSIGRHSARSEMCPQLSPRDHAAIGV